jgi:hypothetical protein
MDLSNYPLNVQELLKELIKRSVISIDSLGDKMFINHICSQRFDKDYWKIRQGTTLNQAS